MKKTILYLCLSMIMSIALLQGTSCHNNSDENAPTDSYCTYKLRQDNITIGNVTLLEGDSFCVQCTKGMADGDCGGPKGGKITVEGEYDGQKYSIDVEIVGGQCGTCHTAHKKFHISDLQLIHN